MGRDKMHLIQQLNDWQQTGKKSLKSLQALQARTWYSQMQWLPGAYLWRDHLIGHKLNSLLIENFAHLSPLFSSQIFYFIVILCYLPRSYFQIILSKIKLVLLQIIKSLIITLFWTHISIFWIWSVSKYVNFKLAPNLSACKY